MNKNDAESSGSENCTESVVSGDEDYHDSVERRNDANTEYSDEDERVESQLSRTDLVLDLRNVPIANIVKSDDETSEKLSAVIEQPEDEHQQQHQQQQQQQQQLQEVAAYRDDLEKKMRERMSNLEEVLARLREQLKQEVSLWRKERDEFQLVRERSDIRALEEATAAARAAAEAYAAESPLSNETIGEPVDLNPVKSLSELTILQYEKKLAKYQDALALAQAEKRYNMRRTLIANTYRQRLDEVERLCNAELENIRQNVSTLQPLRKMASQWCINNDDDADGDVNHGDSTHEDKAGHHQELAEKMSTHDQLYATMSKIGIVVDAPEVNMISGHDRLSKYGRHSVAGGDGKNSPSHLLTDSISLPSNWYATTTSNY